MKKYMEEEEKNKEMEEMDEEEDSSDTPLPTKNTKFGFSDKTAEGGISKLFISALGKLSEKNPQEAYGVIQHLLSALGGSSPQESPPSPLMGPPPGPMGALMGPPGGPPPPSPPPPPPGGMGPPKL